MTGIPTGGHPAGGRESIYQWYAFILVLLVLVPFTKYNVIYCNKTLLRLPLNTMYTIIYWNLVMSNFTASVGLWRLRLTMTNGRKRARDQNIPYMARESWKKKTGVI